MTDVFESTRADARDRDAADDLARFRDRFDLPADHYMDGNSLGPISSDAERTLERVVEEWRDLGIEGWTEAENPWWEYGEYLGERLAPHVGADPDEVVVANSTTVNIHTLIGTFLPEADGDVVVVNELDFPTDHYAIRAQFRQRGLDPDDHLRVVESRDGRTVHPDDLAAAVDDDVGIVFMPTALYRSGQLFDVERLTALAHEHDALAGVDAAHTVGVVPHEFRDAGLDFAVWCSYKYLNAGPGAVAGLYVHERHHGAVPALAGWWGHEKETQFDLRMEYTPAESAGAFQIGTIPVLSAAPLEGALDLLDEAGIDAVREKSLALTDALVDRVDDLADGGYDYTVGTPREHGRRGGHVAVEHPDASRVSRALRDRGVVVDFRPPNVIRICPAPLYVSFEDVHEVALELQAVLDEDAHESYERQDGTVT